MTLRVWACLAGLVPMLGPLAAPSSAALRYTGLGATLQSSTNGAPQAIPATVLRPEGAGPFPAIVIAHDCSGLGAHSSGSPGRWASLLAGEGYVVIIGMMGGSHGGATTLATMVDAASPLVRQARPRRTTGRPPINARRWRRGRRKRACRCRSKFIRARLSRLR
jgi:hypothetical protein